MYTGVVDADVRAVIGLIEDAGSRWVKKRGGGGSCWKSRR